MITIIIFSIFLFISLILSLYFFSANSLNKQLSKKKHQVAFIHSYSRYYIGYRVCIIAVVVFTVLLITNITLIITRTPHIVYVDSYEEYRESIKYSQNKQIAQSKINVTTIDSNTIVQSNFIYLLDTNKIYLIDGEQIKKEKECYGGAYIYSYDNKVIVIEKLIDCTKLLVLTPNLEIDKIFKIDGQLIYASQDEQFINIISECKSSINPFTIGVTPVYGEKGGYPNRVCLLDHCECTNIISHFKIDLENDTAKQKCIGLSDYYLLFDTDYYITFNIYDSYFLKDNSVIIKYNPRSMQISEWKVIDGNVYTAPIIDNEMLYITTYDDENNVYKTYEINNKLKPQEVKEIELDEGIIQLSTTSNYIYNDKEYFYIHNEKIPCQKMYYVDKRVVTLYKENEQNKILIVDPFTNEFEKYIIEEEIGDFKVLKCHKTVNGYNLVISKDEEYKNISINSIKNSCSINNGKLFFIHKFKVLLCNQKIIMMIDDEN